ncbi:MAG: phosphatase PAP2 family protein [Edaphobacter sp.]
MSAIVALLCCFGLSSSLFAQAASGLEAARESHDSGSTLPDAPLPNSSEEKPVTLRGAPVRILKDQALIWTSPLRIRKGDLLWLGPVALATAASLATDHHVMSTVVSHDPDFNQANVDASNVMIGGFLAAPVVLYGVGHIRGDAHAREAGILSGESLVDGLVLEQGIKLIFWRERPSIDRSNGEFFEGNSGVDSSFMSSHSVLAWSAAATMAEEYPSRWAQIGIYTMATGVSLTRVMGQQHFPTDVFLGSVAGWLVGHYVYKAHHRHGSLPR